MKKPPSEARLVVEALSFLRALWQGPESPKERGIKIALWRAQHRTEFFDNLAGLAKRSIEIAHTDDGGDIYYSVGGLRADFHPPSNRPASRGTAADMRLLPALFIDLDVKVGAFPSFDEAKGFLEGLPIRPSAAIHSGTGIHAYWFLKEPMVTSDAKELAEFDALSRGWLEFLRRSAKGPMIDTTCDAARVLRLPGTLRRKGGNPMPVSVLWCEAERRFNPSEFLEFAVAPASKTSSTIELESGLYLDHNSNPPMEKFLALSANDERFAASFARRERKEMKDRSPSAHDQALANFAVRALWTDQEIIDLLAAARRTHGDTPKPLDYFQRTVRTARLGFVDEQQNSVEAARRADFAVRLSEAEASPEGSEPRKSAAVEAARRFTGIELVELVRYVPEPYQYAIAVVGGRRYLIGTARDLREWARWVDAAIDLKFKINPHRPKPDEWLRCVQLLSEFAVDEEQLEFSTQSRSESIIAAYLASFGNSLQCSGPSERHERAFVRAPFTDGMDLFLSVSDLLAWAELRSNAAQKLLRAEELRRLGFAPVTVRAAPPAGAPGRATTRKYQRADMARLPHIRQVAGCEEDTPLPQPEIASPAPASAAAGGSSGGDS